MAVVDIAHIPYKGGGPAMVSVVSGETQITMGSLIQSLPHIRAGRLRALGEFLRVLKPGGHLGLTTWAKDSPCP